MHVPAEIKAIDCLEKHYKLKTGELTEEDILPKPFSNPILAKIQKAHLARHQDYTIHEALNILREASGLNYTADDIDEWKEWLKNNLGKKYPLKMIGVWLDSQQ